MRTCAVHQRDTSFASRASMTLSKRSVACGQLEDLGLLNRVRGEHRRANRGLATDEHSRRLSTSMPGCVNYKFSSRPL